VPSVVAPVASVAAPVPSVVAPVAALRWPARRCSPPSAPGSTGGSTGSGAPTSSTAPTASTGATTAATTATSPTSTRTLTIADIPPAARPYTPLGAQAYVEFFFTRYNQANRQADPTLLDGLYAPSCPACAQYYKTISNHKAANARADSDETVSVSAPITNTFGKSRATVALEVRQNAVRFADPNGRVLSTSPTQSAEVLVSLEYSSRWVVTRVQIVDQ